eukprot:gnl/Hemi2/4404_TR1544_c0_g1_i1.p1 gnl/Hemi2/4404_TR1544_c0_g1~~gnl/Hemi2/4404_TR1544_c0_g1_i1.p1  ORF type:complete len:161 (+),score=33.67 gnl/Hemi2/4404_TR1544_c0_g1_i1:43-525(+)
MEDVIESPLLHKIRERIRLAFVQYDTKTEGRISLKDLHKALVALGYQLGESTMLGMLTEEARSRKSVDYVQYLQLVEDAVRGEELQVAEEDIVDAFSVFDSDEDGFVTVDEIRTCLTTRGSDKLSEQEVNEVLKVMQPDAQQRIDYQAFVRRMRASLTKH